MADDVAAYDFPWTAFSGKYRLRRYRLFEIARLMWRLRRMHFDLVLNARADARNNIIGAVVGSGRFVSASCGTCDVFATDVVALGRDEHRTEDWARVVQKALGVAPAYVDPRLTTRVELSDRMRTELGLVPDNRPVIGIHPGAAAAVRRWELSRFGHVADVLATHSNARLVIFAEPDGYGLQIPLGSPAVFVRRPLHEMIAVLSCCDVFICNDSGPMHIANALGVPVVALFGPGQLEWFGPRGAESRIVRVSKMPCRPCFDACVFAEPHCMNHLSEDDVIANTIDLLWNRAATNRVPASLPGRATSAVAHR
jgi:ADP-heptose:LPS heptosyltransferase